MSKIAEPLTKDEVDMLDRFSGCMGFLIGVSENKTLIDYLKARGVEPAMLKEFHDLGWKISKAFLTPASFSDATSVKSVPHG